MVQRTGSWKHLATSLARAIALAGAFAVLGMRCTEEPCHPPPFEDHSVMISSTSYPIQIQAVTVTDGPCSPLHDCSEDAITGAFSTFCGTDNGSIDKACTFVVQFGVSGAAYQCKITARPEHGCGVHQQLSVEVLAAHDAGLPRCYDDSNDPRLLDASTALRLDSGTD